MVMKVSLFLLICALTPFCNSGFVWRFSQSKGKSFFSNPFQFAGLTKFCPDRWPSPKHVDPEIYQNATQIIRGKGYPCETHKVHTEDGYILTLFRMPGGRKSKMRPDLPPVFLQHGLLDSAHTWIDNLANESFAFILADAGYDVWLGNSRGNTYSRSHEHLSPDSSEFWDFSWDEMAKYDLPACIDYVLKIAGKPKLFYVGHSQGTMIVFARLSDDPQLASKISHFFALGPVANVSHIQSPIRLLTPFANTLAVAFQFFGHGEFLPSNFFVKLMARFLCGEWLTEPICSNVVFLLSGYDCKYTNETRLPVYIAHTPAGTSVKNVVHYIQAIKSKQFQKFDYGKDGNMKKYNQTQPPLYNVDNINGTPISLFYGGIDWLADPTDVKELEPRLKTLRTSECVYDYSHLDFVWGFNAKYVVYNKVMEAMKGGV